MNNLKKLQQLTDTTTTEVADAIDVDTVMLDYWQVNKKIPTIENLEALSALFSTKMDEKGIKSQSKKHPIHIRLSIDYILNLGITLSDWITLKWAFEGQWQGDKLAVGFFSNKQLVRVVETNTQFTEAFAGYLILQTKGQFEPYIDEFDNDRVYDWRLLRINKEKYIDVTNLMISGNVPIID
ncbi:hypothetical protein GCM10025879_05050 [Leuconostoc litchii]|uniref:XRE family transcriptional regulator n=1 Tax=Leuconostoc litchii TaxID=1981069 RepID=A0A6P2CPF6_9LACO|nr:XRE family transcriptional regulator [Leuconostoc litchii]TYC47273.1 XRE family transcriptional regulator [Leuconostoc litchii]GMA69259.1 hypothetical protein GCM10025879_05050 [Leuconostoc litchii]